MGILLPGEGKKLVKGGSATLPRKIQRRESIDFPIIHEKSQTLPRQLGRQKSVKWESESEWSDAEDCHKKRLSLPAPHVWIPGARDDVTPSPSSLSPSWPSFSPHPQTAKPLQGIHQDTHKHGLSIQKLAVLSLFFIIYCID